MLKVICTVEKFNEPMMLLLVEWDDDDPNVERQSCCYAIFNTEAHQR